MADDIYIFTDESDRNGEYYANFYGGVLLFHRHLSEVEGKLNARKAAEHIFGGEMKWQRVTPQYLAHYTAVVDEFFDLVERGLVRVRIIFTQEYVVPTQLQAHHRQNRYFILYYLFIRHAFALAHAPQADSTRYLRLCPDTLPDSSEKQATFRDVLLRMNRHLRHARIVLLPEHITEVCSRESAILQCLDVVLGSMQFRLNNKHLEKAPGTNRRGNRTLAKLKLYQHIRRRICRIRPNFNIGITTGTTANQKFDRWQQPYRHWLFRPRGPVRFDPTRRKPRR